MSRRLRVLAAAFALALSLWGVPGCASTGSSGAGQQAPATQTTVVEQPESAEGSSGTSENAAAPGASEQATVSGDFDFAQLPAYTGSPYVVVNDNVPALTDADAEGPSESYSPLDELGRCGVATAVVGTDTMPTGERGSIGMIKPSGWHTVRYDDLIGDRYLYNRCHLIGWQLTGENANERNLVTGTRYMNVEGMLPFEDEVADYVRSTGNHVVYRSTPVFVGDELVCRGVHLEARSVEDGGTGVMFNVFCYNVQPGIGIDYATGDSWRAEEPAAVTGDDAAPAAAGGGASQQAVPERDYVLNTNTKKFHLPGCRSVSQMSEKNKREVTDTRDDLIAQGYEPCGNCNP